MNANEREEYREKLHTLGRRLQSDLRGITGEALRRVGGAESGGLSNTPLHPADMGTDAYDQEISLGLLENANLIRNEVADALDRLDEGTFGRCEECGRDIATGRLNALPYTRHCVRCAEKIQREEGVWMQPAGL